MFLKETIVEFGIQGSLESMASYTMIFMFCSFVNYIYSQTVVSERPAPASTFQALETL